MHNSLHWCSPWLRSYKHCCICLYLWTNFLCGLVQTTYLFTWSRFIFFICHLLKSNFCTIVCTYYFVYQIIWNSLVVEGVVLCRIIFCEGILILNFKIIWTIDADQSLMVDFETRSLIIYTNTSEMTPYLH